MMFFFWVWHPAGLLIDANILKKHTPSSGLKLEVPETV
jgi:hypothetical protein